jgi:hypothetical protein
MALIETSIEIGHRGHPESHDASFYKAPPSADQLANGVVYDGVTGTYSPPVYPPQALTAIRYAEPPQALTGVRYYA